jgi:hypothetical protein
VHDVELRVRALLRSQVVEVTWRVVLPFVPFPWLVVREAGHGGDDEGLTVQQVVWDLAETRFVCRCLDDVDATATFGDDREGLVASDEARGWQWRDEGPVRRLFLFTEPA